MGDFDFMGGGRAVDPYQQYIQPVYAPQPAPQIQAPPQKFDPNSGETPQLLPFGQNMSKYNALLNALAPGIGDYGAMKSTAIGSAVGQAIDNNDWGGVQTFNPSYAQIAPFMPSGGGADRGGANQDGGYNDSLMGGLADTQLAALVETGPDTIAQALMGGQGRGLDSLPGMKDTGIPSLYDGLTPAQLTQQHQQIMQEIAGKSGGGFTADFSPGVYADPQDYMENVGGRSDGSGGDPRGGMQTAGSPLGLSFVSGNNPSVYGGWQGTTLNADQFSPGQAVNTPAPPGLPGTSNPFAGRAFVEEPSSLPSLPAGLQAPPAPPPALPPGPNTPAPAPPNYSGWQGTTLDEPIADYGDFRGTYSDPQDYMDAGFGGGDLSPGVYADPQEYMGGVGITDAYGTSASGRGGSGGYAGGVNRDKEAASGMRGMTSYGGIFGYGQGTGVEGRDPAGPGTAGEGPGGPGTGSGHGVGGSGEATGTGGWVYGGYTGDDGDETPDEVVEGPVHEREHVLTEETTALIGSDVLDQVNRIAADESLDDTAKLEAIVELFEALTEDDERQRSVSNPEMMGSDEKRVAA